MRHALARRKHRQRRLRSAAVALVVGLTLSACASTTDGTGSIGRAADANLPVIGDTHSALDQTAKNALTDVEASTNGRNGELNPVRMVDSRGEAGLVDQHRDEIGIRREVGVEPLDRHGATDLELISAGRFLSGHGAVPILEEVLPAA